MAVGVGRPAGVAVGVPYAAAGQPEGGFELGGGGLLGALHAAALRGADDDGAVLHLDGSQVGGGLDEVVDLAAHGQHAVGAGVDEVDESLLGVGVDDLLGHVGVAQFELHAGLGGAELEHHGLAHAGDHGLEGAHLVVGHHHEGLGLAGYGVAQVAAVDGGQAHGVAEGALPEDAVEELVGAGAAAVDVVAAVAAHEA